MSTVPDFEAKLCPPQHLPARAASLPRPLVFTNGVFDILHRGHVTYLAQARALGATLLVALPSAAQMVEGYVALGVLARRCIERALGKSHRVTVAGSTG